MQILRIILNGHLASFIKNAGQDLNAFQITAKINGHAKQNPPKAKNGQYVLNKKAANDIYSDICITPIDARMTKKGKMHF